jgi:lipoprotein-anchoring transpeptidase ErfK/SrfK
MPISNRRWFLLAVLAFLPLFAAIVTGPRILERFRSEGSAMRLRVDLSERQLYVIEGGEVTRAYDVAVGTRKHPTPTGRFWTGRIVWNPSWTPPASAWARKFRPRKPGDPRNPMQGVKIYFREPAYFIHGTNAPGSVGTAASHGCIRMRVGDAKSLARKIAKHGSVLMVIER